MTEWNEATEAAITTLEAILASYKRADGLLCVRHEATGITLVTRRRSFVYSDGEHTSVVGYRLRVPAAIMAAHSRTSYGGATFDSADLYTAAHMLVYQLGLAQDMTRGWSEDAEAILAARRYDASRADHPNRETVPDGNYDGAELPFCVSYRCDASGLARQETIRALTLADAVRQVLMLADEECTQHATHTAVRAYCMMGSMCTDED